MTPDLAACPRSLILLRANIAVIQNSFLEKGKRWRSICATEGQRERIGALFYSTHSIEEVGELIEFTCCWYEPWRLPQNEQAGHVEHPLFSKHQRTHKFSRKNNAPSQKTGDKKDFGFQSNSTSFFLLSGSCMWIHCLVRRCFSCFGLKYTHDKQSIAVKFGLETFLEV